MQKLTMRIFSVAMACVLALLSGTNLFAQNKTIKGVVVDDTDQVVIGAAVMLKGTTNGVSTDADGKFTISCNKGDILVVSSVGYEDVEITVGDQTNLTVTLNISSELLDEVIMIGYGTTRAKNFTGSVDVVKMEDSPIAELGLTSTTDMLRGQLSGVELGSESSSAGGSTSILIRGKKSISGGSSPLIVLDGVIYSGSIDNIDPVTIESVSVLKDATSLAAYGSRAANGVIMVTTKKGKEGKPVITFTSSQELAGHTWTPKVLSPENYIKYRNAKLGSSDLTDTSWMSFLEKANYEAGKTTDWIDLATRTAYIRNYNLSFSGKTGRSNYYVGAGHTWDEGVLVGNENTRSNITMRLSTNVTDNIEIGANMTYNSSYDDSNSASISTEASPYMEPYLPDGKTLRYYIEGVNNSSTNPLWNTQYGSEHSSTNNALNLGAYLSVNIPWIEGLNYRINATYYKSNSKSYSFTHENSSPALLSNDWEGIGQSSEYYDLGRASGSSSNSWSVNWVIDNILSYSHQFGKNYVSGSLVYTRDSSESSGDSISGSGFTAAGNTILGVYALGNADTRSFSSPSYSLHTDIGYLARVMYSFADKYHLNASIRRDGSSVFGADRKWGNFPAFGAAWTITKEPFMRSLTWLDMLKLKASWGKNGAQTISPYGTLSTISLAKSGGIANYYDDSIHWGQQISALGNPALGWQTTTSWNGGFEADLFKNRLHMDINAYISKTTDQIFNRNIPVMTAGITTQKATMGQVNNYGVEANASYVILKKNKLNWTTSAVFTLNRNKLIELYGDGKDDVSSGLFIGKPLSTIYGYRNRGIYQEGTYAGRPIFLTADGEETPSPSADDRTFLGYTDANFRLSWSNTVNYGDFQFYVMFNGIFGGGGYGLANNTFAYSTYTTTMTASALDIPFWTAQEPNNTYPSPTASASGYAVYNSYGHVRLQNVSVSYNMKNIAKKLHMSGARVTLSGRNLFFIAPSWKLSDPESRSGSSLGLPRAVTLGINLTI